MKVTGSASRDVRGNVENGDLPKSSAGLVQIYSDKTATSLKLDELVACPIDVVRLDSAERTRGLGLILGIPCWGFFRLELPS